MSKTRRNIKSQKVKETVFSKFNLEEFLPQKFHVIAVILFIFILFLVFLYPQVCQRTNTNHAYKPVDLFLPVLLHWTGKDVDGLVKECQ